jgi:NADP-dependent 3-hydroxy acid dehydrogenase YdfG
MTEELFSIKDKVFIITGGIGQLGQAYMNEILSRKGKVAIFDIFKHENNIVIDLIEKNDKENFTYITTDITQKVEIESAVSKIIERWGKIDILINNAALDSPPDAPE